MAKVSKTKLFLKNLPSETKADQLNSFFGEIGAIHNSFILTNKGEKVCNGMGFVKFTLPSDALKAFEQLNGENFFGSPIHIEFAKKKRNKDSDKKETKDDKIEDNQKARRPKKEKTETPIKKINNNRFEPNSQVLLDDLTGEEKNRSIELIGLNEKIDKKDLAKKLKKVLYSIKQLDGVERNAKIVQCENGKAVLLGDTISTAQKLLHRFDNHCLKGATISTRFFKQQKRGRIIIRNLAWKTTEEDIRKELGVYGAIEQVDIPTKPDGTKRGFAFVQFVKKTSAEDAVSDFNGKKLQNRNVVLDLAVPKEDFLSQQKQLQTLNNSNTDQQQQQDKEDLDDDDDNNNQDDQDDDDDNQDRNQDDDDDDDDEEREEESEKKRKREKKGKKEKEEEREEERRKGREERRKRGEEEKEEREKKRRERMEDSKDGKTLFVRNLAFSTTEEVLREKFKEFGELESVTLVKTKDTNINKGSAFVRFKEKETVEKILERFPTNVFNSPFSQQHPRQQRNQQHQLLSEMYQEDGGLMLEGRVLFIQLALPTSSLQSAQKQLSKQHALSQSDPQNLYLLDEGKVEENSLSAKGLTSEELEMRKKVALQNKKKLEDQNCFVSKNRLAVMNLPNGMTAPELKKIFRECLMKTERRKLHPQNVIIASSKHNNKPLNFGFVVFDDHNDALSALRAVNNNPHIPDTSGRRLIVQFSVENKLALQKQKTKKAQLKRDKENLNMYTEAKFEEKNNRRNFVSSSNNEERSNKRKFINQQQYPEFMRDSKESREGSFNKKRKFSDNNSKRNSKGPNKNFDRKRKNDSKNKKKRN